MATACIICGNDSELQPGQGFGPSSYNCVRCGRFKVDFEFAEDHPLGREKDQKWKLVLSSVIREATDIDRRRGLLDCIGGANLQELLSRARRPVDPIDQANRFILAVGRACKHVGAMSEWEHREAWAARAWLPDSTALQEMTEELVRLEWLKRVTQFLPNREDPAGTDISFGLSYRGWERATELERVHGDGKQAFIAMWFDPRMAVVSTDAIQPALHEVGYSHYQVNLDAHEHRIDDKIHAEIRRSRILVAECTGVRPSAYYEAGLAMGLDLEVIWCCFDLSVLKPGETAFAAPQPLQGSDPWFKQLAFDTRQYTFLQWATLASLKQSIIDRIRARGLDRRQKRI